MRICDNCGNFILRKSLKAKYCSSNCKYEAYRLRNPEKVKQTQLKYNKNNPEKRRETWRKYRLKTGRSKTIWTDDLINFCVECGIKFHPTRFVPYKKYCSPQCRNRYNQRNWQKNNPEKQKEIMKNYDKSEKGKARRKRNYPKKKEYNKKWLLNNPEKTAEYSKNYREKNPERAKQVRDRYKKSLKGILANRKRSHIKRMLKKYNYNHNKLIPIIVEQNGQCPLCHIIYEPDFSNMELGHIFPMKKYPEVESEPDNLLPICRTCNRRMREKLFSEYCKLHNLPIPKRVSDYVKRHNYLIKN